jgi:hypothetical protein
MHFLGKIFLVLLLSVMLTACVKASNEEKVKVQCPKCGTDFDALFHTRF